MDGGDSPKVPESQPTQTHLSPTKYQNPKTPKLCRSCLRCRSKKTKCSGDRPRCTSCAASSFPCNYLEDARRTGGINKGNLEKEVSQLRQLVEQYRKKLGSPLREPATPPTESESRNNNVDAVQVQVNLQSHSEPAFPAPSREVHTLSEHERSRSETDKCNYTANSLSPSEANVAGAFSEDGRMQFHGVTSTLHQGPGNSDIDHPYNIPATDRESMSNKLISYAALQRQHENFLFVNPLSSSVDLDGVPLETAKHLLDIHWNRQHFTYLLTYRPAIIESLRTSGPYINKLLLNAIYYTSCQYSDRASLRSDPNDPQTMGAKFYRRFKELLVDEIDKPSIPTAIALLLSGQCLVAYGKQGGGWVLCGTAYRMIIELGCHLSVNYRQANIDSSDIVATEVRKRLYWGAFVIDKFQSLYLGRSPALRQVEARVSNELLDTFEELEPWAPYMDPGAESFEAVVSAHTPRPAYGVSSFKALLRLAEIAADIIDTFYSMESLKLGQDIALEKRIQFLKDLEQWHQELPIHLHYSPEANESPPPHQLNPHTTFWTLSILVGRPFMSNGHLSRFTDPVLRSAVEQGCATAALKIWGLVKAYKNSFTLRRAPYILCYATYHAVLVLLHVRETQVNFPDCVPYLWSALVDLKHGSHAGLTKPLQILKSKLSEDVFMAVSESHDAQHEGHGVFEIGVQGEMELGENVPGLANAEFLQSLDFDAWNTPFWLDRVIGNQLLQDDSNFGRLMGQMPF